MLRAWEMFYTFLTAFFKGVLLAVLLGLPWLIRLAAVLLWLTGGALAIEAIRTIYQPFTPPGAVFALQFAVIFLLVAWAGVLLRRGRLWGGLTVGGLVLVLLVRYAFPWFLGWQYASLVSRILPPALFALGLMYLTFRLRFFKQKEYPMNETQTNSMIDALLGRDIQTDHGGLTLGDVIVLLLDLVLLIYTGWRSYDFLTTSVPQGYEILALVGLWGLDLGAVAWSLVWIFGSASKYQDWVSMFFFVFDLVGVVLTSLTDSLLYGQAEGVLSVTLKAIAVVVVPLIVVANVVAGFIYHLTSPQTRERRAKRKAEHEYRLKMMQLRNMERDLAYAEAYLLARQEILDKSAAMAKIKIMQDQIERQTRLALRDLTGIHGLTTAPQAGEERLAELRKRLETIQAQQLVSGNGHTPEAGAGGAAANPPDRFPEE